MAERKDRPVLTGLLALLGVGLAVGLVLGLGTLGATKFLGVGGDAGEATSTRTTGGETLYLPDPSPTETDTSPAFTIDADPRTSAASTPTSEPTEEETPEDEISLSAAQSSVSPMERIDLTGTFAQGEGSILAVQRFEEGSWRDFGVTMSVRGGLFSTYIQTGRVGEHRLRVRDTDSDLVSNEVTVTVG